MKSISEWTQEIHKLNVEKGWWHNDQGELVDRNPLEIYALIHSEVSEAVEEARKRSPPVYQESRDGKDKWTPSDQNNLWVEGLKPEGELIELADVVIRILDFCGHKGWDLEAAMKLKFDYNKTRERRHGNKKY